MSEEVYRFIRAYIETHGYAPSIREIARGCYLCLSMIVRYLDLLEARGRIRRERGKARSITVVTPEE